jgi:hypothetical protein
MDLMKEHVTQIRFFNRKREDALPELRRDYEEKLQNFGQYEKTRQLKKDLEELATLYIWAQVDEHRRVSRLGMT